MNTTKKSLTSLALASALVTAGISLGAAPAFALGKVSNKVKIVKTSTSGRPLAGAVYTVTSGSMVFGSKDLAVRISAAPVTQTGTGAAAVFRNSLTGCIEQTGDDGSGDVADPPNGPNLEACTAAYVLAHGGTRSVTLTTNSAGVTGLEIFDLFVAKFRSDPVTHFNANEVAFPTKTSRNTGDSRVKNVNLTVRETRAPSGYRLDKGTLTVTGFIYGGSALKATSSDASWKGDSVCCGQLLLATQTDVAVAKPKPTPTPQPSGNGNDSNGGGNDTNGGGNDSNGGGFGAVSSGTPDAPVNGDLALELLGAGLVLAAGAGAVALHRRSAGRRAA